jgi:hypothetical protein
MTEGIIQKTFNQFRAERLGRSITHSETLTLENRLIEEIKKNVSDWSKQSNPPLPRYVKLDVLIGDTN